MEKVELLVFTDASFEVETGKSACGVVMVDNDGKLRGFQGALLGILDSTFEAEIIGIRIGLSQARKIMTGKIGICSDNLEAINAINGKEELRCRGGYTLNTILKELLLFKDCKFVHISRYLNSAANDMARYAASPADLPDWVGTKMTSWMQELWSDLLDS